MNKLLRLITQTLIFLSIATLSEAQIFSNDKTLYIISDEEFASPLSEIINEFVRIYKIKVSTNLYDDVASDADISTADVIISNDIYYLKKLKRQNKIENDLWQNIFVDHLVIFSKSNLEPIETNNIRKFLQNNAQQIYVANPQSILGKLARETLQSLFIWENLKNTITPLETAYVYLNNENSYGIGFFSDLYNHQDYNILYHFPTQKISYHFAIVSQGNIQIAKKLKEFLKTSNNITVIEKLKKS